MTDIAQFLTRVPMFQGLTERQLKRLAGRFRERTYTKDAIVVEQGKIGIGLFVVVEGEAEVIRTHVDGTVIRVDTLAATDFFGELSLLDDAPRTASVRALGDLKCIALSKLDFLDELHDDPEMAVEMLKTMAHRFRRLVANL